MSRASLKSKKSIEIALLEEKEKNPTLAPVLINTEGSLMNLIDLQKMNR